jgi:hypothetical protein
MQKQEIHIIFFGNLKGRVPLRDVGEDKKTILKQVIEK